MGKRLGPCAPFVHRRILHSYFRAGCGSSVSRHKCEHINHIALNCIDFLCLFIPCAMVYGLYALSPVSGLFSHRSPGLLSPRVDPSVGRSRPRDFAVPISALRLPRSRVHRIPLPTSVTIAIRPSWWRRDVRIKATDLPDAASAEACDRVTRRAICAWHACAMPAQLSDISSGGATSCGNGLT